MFLIDDKMKNVPIIIFASFSRHGDPLDGNGALGLGVDAVGTSLSQIDPFFTV